MTGYAAFTANKSLAEEPIAVTIRVQDMNDNPPVFQPVTPVGIYEDSPVGGSSSALTTFHNCWATGFFSVSSLQPYSWLAWKPSCTACKFEICFVGQSGEEPLELITNYPVIQ